MEIPERLLGDFKTLERYGHAMKKKHKSNFKRHIKMDDSGLCLYMDAYIPKAGDWVRIDMDIAKADNAKRQKKISQLTEKKLLCTAESDSDE